MDPDQIDSTTQGTDAGAVTQPPAERTFSQEEVNRISAKARQEGRDSVAKKQGSAPAPRTENSTPTDRVAALEAELADTKLQRNFDRLASKHGIPDDAVDDLFDLFKAQRPDDPSAWFQAKSTRFGFTGATSMPTTTPPVSTPEPTRPAPAAPSAPARVDTPNVGGIVNIYGGITAEQFQNMSPQQLREHHERNVTAAQRRTGAPPVPQPKR